MSERIEHDSMGEVRVPADALWGAQTARAVENFPISGLTMPPAIVHALALVKAAAARVNAELGALDAERAAAIEAAAREVARGRHDDQFPIDVFQTGSGTSTNMNVNEVVARLAHLQTGLSIHPNDHVNAGQSSNDTFPTAIRLAAVTAVAQRLAPALAHLETALARKEAEFATVVKAGRTHLMDAVPVTLGQEFSGYARQVGLGRARVLHAAAGRRRAAAGRHGRRHRPQRRTGVRRGRHRGARRGDRHPAARGGQPLRGPGQPGRAGGAQRSRQGGRGQPHQDLQRPAVDELGPAGRARRDPPARPPAGLQHHARQGQPGRPGGHAHGVRAGHRQRRDDHRWPARAAASSSTSCCRSSAAACWSR